MARLPSGFSLKALTASFNSIHIDLTEILLDSHDVVGTAILYKEPGHARFVKQGIPDGESQFLDFGQTSVMKGWGLRAPASRVIRESATLSQFRKQLCGLMHLYDRADRDGPDRCSPLPRGIVRWWNWPPTGLLQPALQQALPLPTRPW